MNIDITKKLAAIKARYKESRQCKNYDHYRIQRNANKTIGMVKADRLRIKNMRRAENGLPPKATYAEI